MMFISTGANQCITWLPFIWQLTERTSANGNPSIRVQFFMKLLRDPAKYGIAKDTRQLISTLTLGCDVVFIVQRRNLRHSHFNG